MKKILLFFLFILSALLGISQNKPLSELIQSLSNYSSNNFQEKIFLHTNSNLWVAGETAWFKVYLLDSRSHQLSNTSSVVYFEILTRDNKVLLDSKIHMTNGEGYGQISIPPSLASDNYYLRAYTRWMKNFDSELYFHQPITILNTFRNLFELDEVKSETSLDVQFFPEGGQLIDGVANKVAFRATDNLGKGIDFSGVITNQNGDTVATIKSEKFGIGSFKLTPLKSEGLKAIINYEGRKFFFDLPSIQETGYSLMVSDTLNNLLSVLITLKGGILNQSVYLIGHTRQKVGFANSYILKNGNLLVTIDKKKFLPGISNLILFNENGLPVCERLIFIKPPDNYSLSVKVDKPETSTRKKVLLDINSFSSIDKSISVSVHRLDQLSQFSQPTIIDYLLLTSDLKGTIESPRYYLEASESEIDNLMLTHGWSRYKWENLSYNQLTKFIPEYRGHLLEAILTDVDGRPVEGAEGYINTPGARLEFSGAMSNSEGRILIKTNSKNYNKLILQTRASETNIKFISPFSNQYSSFKLPPIDLSPKYSSEIVRKSISMQLTDLMLEKKLIKYDSVKTPFYGIASESYKLDDYTRFPLMEEVFREYVKSVRIRKRDDNFVLKIMDQDKGILMEGESLVLLDGIPIFNINDLMSIDPLKIKYLDVVPSRYFAGQFEFDGILSYISYKGDLGELQVSPEAIIVNYEGLQQFKEFYSPRYETVPEINSRIPDGRHLLYWNPEVQISGNETKQLEFYTSDQPGRYKVIVQGITADGTPLYGETTFTVVR